MDLPVDVNVLRCVSCAALSHSELLGQLLLSAHARLLHRSLNFKGLDLSSASEVQTYALQNGLSQNQEPTNQCLAVPQKGQTTLQTAAWKDKKKADNRCSWLFKESKEYTPWSLQSLC